VYVRLVVLKLDPSFSHNGVFLLFVLVWSGHCMGIITAVTLSSHLSPLSSLRSTPLCTPRPDCSQMEWSLSMQQRGHYTTAESLPS
jgi:hypothetical protein